MTKLTISILIRLAMFACIDHHLAHTPHEMHGRDDASLSSNVAAA